MNTPVSRRRRWLFRSLVLGACLLFAELLAMAWLHLVLPGSTPAIAAEY